MDRMTYEVGRHSKRGTAYVKVRIGPHAPDIAEVTTVAGSTYLVRTNKIDFVAPDMDQIGRNLGVLFRTLTRNLL